MTGVPHPPDQVSITRAERQRRAAQRYRKHKKTHGPGPGDIFLMVLLAAVAVMLYVLVESKISGKAPELAGRQFYIVQSSSMKPLLKPGSLLAVKQVEPAELKEKDIITFTDPDHPLQVVSHRIVAISDAEELTFTTRGDAAARDDPAAVPAESIIGKGTFFIPYAGYALGFIQTTVGLISAVLVPALLIIIFELRKLLRPGTAPKEERGGGLS